MSDDKREIERETTVIHTERGGGGSGVIIAIVVLFILGAIAFFFLGGYFDKPADKMDVSVNVETPTVELPDIKIETQPAQPANRTGD